MGSSTTWNDQQRKMEWSTCCAARAEQAGLQGRDGILQTFPCLTQALQASTCRQVMLSSCWGLREQAAMLPPGYRAVQISPQCAWPTQHGRCRPCR